MGYTGFSISMDFMRGICMIKKLALLSLFICLQPLCAELQEEYNFGFDEQKIEQAQQNATSIVKKHYMKRYAFAGILLGGATFAIFGPTQKVKDFFFPPEQNIPEWMKELSPEQLKLWLDQAKNPDSWTPDWFKPSQSEVVEASSYWASWISTQAWKQWASPTAWAHSLQSAGTYSIHMGKTIFKDYIVPGIVFSKVQNYLSYYGQTPTLRWFVRNNTRLTNLLDENGYFNQVHYALVQTRSKLNKDNDLQDVSATIRRKPDLLDQLRRSVAKLPECQDVAYKIEVITTLTEFLIKDVIAVLGYMHFAQENELAYDPSLSVKMGHTKEHLADETELFCSGLTALLQNYCDNDNKKQRDTLACLITETMTTYSDTLYNDMRLFDEYEKEAFN